MFSFLKFYYKKIHIGAYILFKKFTKNEWRIVEGVYLPLWNSIGFNTLRWIVNGQYEQNEISIIKAKLKQGDRVLEIGTGLGFVSTFCANSIGSENVFTFEANPMNVTIAKKVFTKNKVKPTITNALLDTEEGITKFPVNYKSRLASSLFIDRDNNFVTINKISLNVQINKINPTFLLMDIEGGEYYIFKNIQFKNINKIQFELHPKILGQIKCNEIFDVLLNNGFQKDTNISRNDNFFFFKKVNS